MQRKSNLVQRILFGVAGTTLVAYGAKRQRLAVGAPLMALGGSFVVRALAPQSLLTKVAPPVIEAEHVVCIARPAAELFAFWRKLENCASWMQEVREVRETGARTSHWVVRGPGKSTIAYDAEIIDEVQGERFVWVSTGNAPIKLRGEVSFVDTERGAEVRVRLSYAPPAGIVGAAVASFSGLEPTALVKEDLRRFKMLTEAGEIATNESPSARKKPRAEPGTLIKHSIDAVNASQNVKTKPTLEHGSTP